MFKGKAIFEDAAALGAATETAVFKHLFARVKREHDVDLVAEAGGELIPFEVKYRAQHSGARELKGLIELCQAKRIARGYVVTKSLDDFGPMEGLPPSALDAPTAAAQLMRIPAPLLCYWMGATETPADAHAGDIHDNTGGTTARKN